MNAIRFKGASKIYRRSHLGRETETVGLAGIDLDIARGEVFGLLGLNGSGKTTAIKLLMGLHLPTKGTVEALGVLVPDLEVLARVGYAPDAAYLNHSMTARENLAFFARLYGVDDVDAAVARGLALSGLAERARDRVKTFSGGMQRRLNLAVAMVGEPELALLDEPMVGVDPQSRHHILASIEKLADDDRALLYTSHSMDEVQKLCDRVAILDRGKLVDCGTADELATRAGVPGADLETTFLELTGHSLRDGGA